MTIKAGKMAVLMVSGLLLTSWQTSAVDIPITITGTVQIPSCQINNGGLIEVNFGNISVEDVTHNRNHRKINVPINCTNTQGTAYVKVIGTPLGSNSHVLATNINNFGIALYQGDSVSNKLILGEGAGSIGYPINAGLSGNSFTFTAALFKNGGGELSAGSFKASATMSIRYN